MATQRQKRAVNIIAEKIEEKKPVKAGEVLLEAGYSKSIAERPKSVFDSKGFKEYLNSIDARPIIEKWYRWALEDKDKRVSLKAGENVITLKDLWPKTETKILSLFTNIQKLENETDNKD
jgi:hypothetical protein